MTQTDSRTMSDFLKIPLAIGSFVFFKTMRFVMRGFVALMNRLRRGKPAAWRVISADLIGKPLALPVLMTRAPRWNPHAIIGTAGPLNVRSSVSVHIGQANASAAIWGFVLQRENGGEEVRLSSVEETGASWKTFQVPAGNYTLVVRYYHPGRDIKLPAIRIDGRDHVEAKTIDPDNNRFYESLAQRTSWLYRWLNFYVYSMLRFADWLPGSFVKKEFLPAGDPGMKYHYGATRRNTVLHISVKPELSASYSVYLTRYNRASFPVDYRELRTADTSLDTGENDGYYLIRLLPQKGGRTDLEVGDLLTVTQALAPAVQGSPA